MNRNDDGPKKMNILKTNKQNKSGKTTTSSVNQSATTIIQHLMININKQNHYH